MLKLELTERNILTFMFRNMTFALFTLTIFLIASSTFVEDQDVDLIDAS